MVFEFNGVPFHDRYLEQLRAPSEPDSLGLSDKVRQIISETCDEEYARAYDLMKKQLHPQTERAQIGNRTQN